MVSGHLQVKKGQYYIVLNYVDQNGKRCRPNISTGLPEKGNKRKAEKMLFDIRSNFEIPKETELDGDMPFWEYMTEWLEIVKVRIKPTTFASYCCMVKSTIAPYFKRKNVTLSGLEPRHLQSFYTEKLRTVKPNTVIHYHAVIHQALKYAVKTEIIMSSPADKIDRPKKNDFTPNFYDSSEMAKLFEAVKGHRLELPVLVGAFYGMRRGEVLGLRWNAIDFDHGTITVKHTVTSFNLDGKHVQIEQDSAKTKSSMRTLPLVDGFREYFQKIKSAQELNKQVCGKAYSYKYDGYVFVDELGELMKPAYITAEFPRLLERNGLRRIRYHDLRHSCASLLLANGVPMKQIQEWLGHSDFSTTANVYAHLDYTSKISSAQAMEKGITLPDGFGLGGKWENC